MEFNGAKLKELRESRCFGQREFAKELGIHATTLCRWENGGVPHPKRIRELAEKLGVDFKVFIKKAKKAVTHG